MKENYTSEARIVLVGCIIVVAAIFGGFVLYRAGNEADYVSAEASQPLKPRFVRTSIEYEPLTANDRVSYVHSLPEFQRPSLPIEIAAGHSYAAAEPNK